MHSDNKSGRPFWNHAFLNAIRYQIDNSTTQGMQEHISLIWVHFKIPSFENLAINFLTQNTSDNRSIREYVCIKAGWKRMIIKKRIYKATGAQRLRV